MLFCVKKYRIIITGGRDMSYTVREVLEFVKQNDVKFIRLAFCDMFGTQKNISITHFFQLFNNRMKKGFTKTSAHIVRQ